MRRRSLEVIDQIAQEEEPIATSHWYAVYRAESLKKDPVRVRRLGRELVLWRDGAGTARAADARCPHRGADLGLGRVVGGELACPYHGFQWDGGGACTKMPCEGRDARPPGALHLSMCAVREEAGFIWLWHGASEGAGHDEPLPWVPGMDIQVVGSACGEMEWPVRFSRVMEGMMDMHHVPFAHRFVTPPGYERLDPYEVRVEGSVVYTKGTLRKESAPRDSGITAEINVAYPGVIHVRFYDRFQGIAVCTPIDGEHTWIAIRYAQRYIPIPGLRWLIAWLLIKAELRFIQPDDLRILRSTNPRTAGLRSNVLVRADRGLAAWHKLHARALAASRGAGTSAPSSDGTTDLLE